MMKMRLKIFNLFLVFIICVSLVGSNILIEKKVFAAGSLGSIEFKGFPFKLSNQGQSTLKDGRVLISGGQGLGGGITSNVFIYDPSKNVYASVAKLPQPLRYHSQSTLPDGRIMVTGGDTANNFNLNTVYIYDPITDQWTTSLPLPIGISRHAQSVLSDGRVLITALYSGVTKTLIYNPSTYSSTYGADLPLVVSNQGQSTLSDGRVMVTGGNSNNTYIYDINSNSWTNGASLPVTALYGHAQVTLQDGKVLVTGGFNSSTNSVQSSSFIYNPTNNNWSTVASLPYGFMYHGNSVLNDGRVLITGGNLGGYQGELNGVYVLNVASNSWSAITDGNLPKAAAAGVGSIHAQSTLTDGRVLITGGNTSYIYNPNTNLWTNGPNLTQSLYRNRQSTLSDGRVLVTGGSSSIPSTFVYSPSTNTWSSAADLPLALFSHGQSTMQDGRVLVVGGKSASLNATQYKTYIYNPSTNTWSNAANMPVPGNNGLQDMGISTLNDGRVLVTGGNPTPNYGTQYIMSESYIYSPSTDTWTTAASVPSRLAGHIQSTLKNGKVLVAGGINYLGNYSIDAYLYDPQTNSWTTVTGLFHGLSGATQSTLNDGRILIAGGYDAYESSNTNVVFSYNFNEPPTISIPNNYNNVKVSNNTGYNTINLSGTVKDSDSGNVISVMAQIDSNNAQTLQSITSNTGVQNFGTANVSISSSLAEGTHTMKIWAQDNWGAQSSINSYSIIIDKTGPSLPVLSATNLNETSLSLNWTVSTDSSGVAGYDIYNGTTFVGSTTLQTTYSINGLLPSTAYNFTVKARDSVGNVTASNVLSITTPDLTAPTVPVNLISTSVTNNSVSLSWSTSTDNVGVVGYDIYNGATLVGTVTGTTYSVNGLTPSTTYNFSVKSRDAAGNTAASSILVVSTGSDTDSTPAGSTSLTYNTPMSSYISLSGDVDYYAYTASWFGVDQITVTVPTDKNYDVYVLDSTQDIVAAGLHRIGVNEQILFKVTPGSKYYIKVFASNGDFSTTVPYTVDLTKSGSKTDYQYDTNGNLKSKTTTLVP